MSEKEKVTIKFWDRVLDRYSFKPSWYYFLDKDNKVYCQDGEDMEEQLHIEPHFYISDKRIG